MTDQIWENVGADNCVRCAVACHTDELSDEGYCAGCVETTAAEVESARAGDFRWMAHDFLTREIARKPLHVLVDERWAAEKLTSGSVGTGEGNQPAAAPLGSARSKPAQPDVRLLTDRVVAVVVADSMARARALIGERFSRVA